MRLADIPQAWTRTPGESPTPLVALSFIKTHCRLPTDSGFTEDDALLTQYTIAAESHLESLTDRVYSPNVSFTLKLPELPTGPCLNGMISLPLERVPVTSVDTVKYYRRGEDTLTDLVEGVDYRIHPAVPCRLLVSPDLSLDDRPDAFQVAFKAGHSSSPARANITIAMLVAYWYRNREAFLKSPDDLAFENLVNSLCWRTYP